MKKGIEIKLFTIGIVIYLVGLFLLFGSAIGNTNIFSKVFNFRTINILKIIGGILFLVGFLMFIYSLAVIYKKNYILEKNKDLVVEGKADVITLIVMYFVELLMLVICLIFNEYIGALLFGLVIIIQSVLNTVLIKYFSKGGKL
ncbi:MAG: hypothetical protein IKQ29_01220 [Bacilli bacterium]|nr:hypothetical protein [Bacilli bacterium]